MNVAQAIFATIGVLICFPFILYLAARVVFTAYFFTRQQFNKGQHHGQKQQG